MHGHRLYAYAVALLVIGALLWPVSGLQKRDSFPLSFYPMFTAPRRRVVLYAVVGLRKGDNHLERSEPIPPRLVGNHEVMQTAMIIRRAVRKGRESRQRLCQQVAAAVAQEPRYAHVDTVAIVRDIYDPVRYFAAAGERRQRQRLSQCEIVR